MNDPLDYLRAAIRKADDSAEDAILREAHEAIVELRDEDENEENEENEDDA